MNPEHLEKIFAALNAAGVRYLVVGGLAVLAHGYLRVTRDLDLVIALDGSNPQRSLELFASFGYRRMSQSIDGLRIPKRHWKVKNAVYQRQ